MASSITSVLCAALDGAPTTPSTFTVATSSFSSTITVSGAIDSNFPTGILSGSSSLFSGTLQFVLSGSSAGTTLLDPTSAILRLPSSKGVNTYYGYVQYSTFNSAASSALVNIRFNGSDFVNTIICLSANKTAVRVDRSTTESVIDIPFIYPGSIDNDVNNNVSYIHTVGDFLRVQNLNG